MADFVTELFQNIFTPGVGGPLLIATNVAFASLQVVLLSLLIATYSYHFAILSVLSAGLWGSINWFVRETAIEAERLAAIEQLKKESEEREEAEEQDDAATVVGTDKADSGSKEVEVVENRGELIDRKPKQSPAKSITGDSTENTEGMS